MSTTINEVAPDIFRINTYIPDFNLGFSQFLVRDDEPLLFHTGMRGLFPTVREAVAKLIDPTKLRWMGFSHFEADECGAINEWQAIAPDATPVSSMIGKMVSVDDFATRPAKGMVDGEEFSTGKHTFRFIQTPHVPHGWDAGLLFDTTTGLLFSSDLLHQSGDVEPLTSNDVLGRAKDTLVEYQASPLADYFPYTPMTESILARLSALNPKFLATMHGSVFEGNAAKVLREYSGLVRDVFGPGASALAHG
jgi:flavorubredoxin